MTQNLAIEAKPCVNDAQMRAGPQGSPPLAADLRQHFREAGVHIYLDTNDVVMVGGGYLAVHAASAGKKIIRHPAAVDWLNVRTGETLARTADQIEVEMAHDETLLLSVSAIQKHTTANSVSEKVS